MTEARSHFPMISCGRSKIITVVMLESRVTVVASFLLMVLCKDAKTLLNKSRDISMLRFIFGDTLGIKSTDTIHD